MKNLLTILAVITAIGVLSACSEQAPVQGQQGVYVPQVEVAAVAVQSIATWHEFTGTTQAPQSIDLRPRVSGYISQVHFSEGSTVSAGDLLVSIDSAPFAAEVNRLNADLNIAISQAQLAKKEYDRALSLNKSKAISQGQLDTFQANVQQSNARTASVKAALESAELQLSYTQIRAPISGRISNAYITRGNYVSAGSSVLTNLVSTEQLYTYFDANQDILLDFKRARAQANAMPILMSVNSENSYDISGKIDFVDNRINVQTGTIRARAVINNEDGFLVPGLFSRLRVYGEATDNAVLIKDEAIGTDLSNKFVLVVNSDNIAEYRAITLGEKIHGLRIVTHGLLASDKIVVNGLQRVRPGSEVAPIDVTMASNDALAQINQTQTLIARIKEAAINSELVAAKRQQLPVASNNITAGK